VKHIWHLYATHAFRNCVAMLTVGLVLAPSVSALQPWRPHIRDAARYADGRAGGISFGVRTRLGLRARGVGDGALGARGR
jgi:hypothetical protein